MILGILLLAAGTALAEPSVKPAARHTEGTLRGMLSKLRQSRAFEAREVMMGGGEELRDAVATGSGHEKKRLAGRLPGMAEDPFAICRDLAGCRESPLSLHVDEDAIMDDAFLALARPWFRLQEARGKAVTVTVDPGVGVRLELEDSPALPFVTLSALPTPTGGFDVTVEEGADAAKVFAAGRAAVLLAPAGS